MSRLSRNGVFRTAMILVLGVLIGAVFTVSSSASWLGDILNEDKTPVPSTPPASAVTRSVVIGPTGLADMVDRVSPAVVNIEATVKTDSGYIDPFFNDPFFGTSSVTDSRSGPGPVIRPVSVRGVLFLLTAMY